VTPLVAGAIAGDDPNEPTPPQDREKKGDRGNKAIPGQRVTNRTGHREITLDTSRFKIGQAIPAVVNRV
jgi:hypothetical protein